MSCCQGQSLMLKDSFRAALKQPSCMNNWHMAAHEFRWGRGGQCAMHACYNAYELVGLGKGCPLL
jgi:hypothetical protein